MAWPSPGYPTANLPGGNNALALLDAVLAAIGNSTIIYCTVGGGANAIVLTPAVNEFAPTAYAANQNFAFLATANSTGNVTIQVGALTSLNVYQSDGVTQVGSGTIVSGQLYTAVYAASLNSGAGGFFLEYVPSPGASLAIVGGFLQRQELVRAVSGTSDTVLSTDRGKFIKYSNAGAIAVTLPSAASAGFGSGWFCDVISANTGIVTITPTTSTIDGQSNLALAKNQGIRIVSDGVNYFTQRGVPASSNGSVTSVFGRNGTVVGVPSRTGTNADYNGQLIKVEVFTRATSGTQTWFKNTACNAIRVWGVAGGGAGGSVGSNAAGNLSAAGGGGGGGMFVQWIKGVVSTAASFVVGKGGASSSNGNIGGGNGGASTFTLVSPSFSLVAGAGAGGSGSTSNTAGASAGGNAGAGSGVSSTNGGFGVAGTQGGWGFFIINGFAIGGSGGASGMGTGSVSGKNVGGAGTAGGNYGAGGAGASRNASQAGAEGGAGAQGIIIVESYT